MSKPSTIIFTVILGLLFSSCNVENSDSNHHPITNPNDFTVPYIEAFNKHDAKAVASYWTEDALYTNPVSGVSVKGRSAIEEEFNKWFDEGNVDKLEARTLKVQMVPEEDSAIAKGVFSISFKDDTEPYQNAFQAFLVKENGKWLIDQISQVEMNQPKSPDNNLKELAWMIGDWIDKDEDSIVETKVQWDKYKNFITQNFNVTVFDQHVLEGKQIIVWDPISKQIRSWVFDSDGGFGEGKWTKRDKSWFVESVYTLADGRKASAIHIYTPVDKDSYTWASEGRDIAGVILPNIDPVKISRINSKEAQ